MTRTRTAAGLLIVGLALVATGMPTTAFPPLAPFPDAVNVVPAAPKTGGCIPFGNNTDFGFSGFIYRNVPAFKVFVGTPIAFDLSGTNDVDVRRDIYFSAADHNPGTANGPVRALKWVKVVSETQLPSSPRGNTTIGDYELRYRSEAPFTFDGGGFIIGFGASPPGFHPDSGCEPVGVHTSGTDASGLFYARFWSRPDRDMSFLDRGTFSTTLISGFVIFTDITPPVVTATITPEPGADGWVSPGSATVAFTGTDDGSGVASCDEPVQVTQPGVGEVTGSCTDHAGNVGTTTVTVRMARHVTVDVLRNPRDAVNSHRRGPATFIVRSDEAFDAHRLEHATIRFGVTGSETSVGSCAPAAADLECRFDFAVAGVAPSMALTGYADGVKTVGSGPLNLVGVPKAR